MIFWLKDSKDGIIKIEDTKWNNYFYLANDNISNLEKVLYGDYKEIYNLIKRVEYVNKYEKVTDEDKSQVLKLYT